MSKDFLLNRVPGHRRLGPAQCRHEVGEGGAHRRLKAEPEEGVHDHAVVAVQCLEAGRRVVETDAHLLALRDQVGVKLSVCSWSDS